MEKEAWFGAHGECSSASFRRFIREVLDVAMVDRVDRCLDTGSGYHRVQHIGSSMSSGPACHLVAGGGFAVIDVG